MHTLVTGKSREVCLDHLKLEDDAPCLLIGCVTHQEGAQLPLLGGDHHTPSTGPDPLLDAGHQLQYDVDCALPFDAGHLHPCMIDPYHLFDAVGHLYPCMIDPYHLFDTVGHQHLIDTADLLRLFDAADLLHLFDDADLLHLSGVEDLLHLSGVGGHLHLCVAGHLHLYVADHPLPCDAGHLLLYVKGIKGLRLLLTTCLLLCGIGHLSFHARDLQLLFNDLLHLMDQALHLLYNTGPLLLGDLQRNSGDHPSSSLEKDSGTFIPKLRTTS